ncbi:MAG: SDR family NAD(P)-dependent oxidoreductase [Desulfomonile tiedjei]|nr:SDR family NAD(P)-dependent oxidoreductase [Desulfomonile tiedjei]
MKLVLPFGLEIPVLYVNPRINADAGLIEEASRAGGLGIVDHVTSGPANFHVPGDVPHGLRVSVKELQGLNLAANVRLALIPLEDSESVAELEPGALKALPVPVLIEVGSAQQAQEAESAGAAGLVARGNEGPGWVSETSGFVLIQEILAVSGLPLFLQGGVGMHTAAAAVAAGATGVVLDVHLLLSEGSAIPQSLKDFLAGLSLPATVTLAEGSSRPLRVYSRVGTRMVRELKKDEESLTPEEFPNYCDRLAHCLRNPVGELDKDETLLAMSEDIVAAKGLSKEFGTAASILAAFGRKMSEPVAVWPFGEDSEVCRGHGTRFPIVQGPMAHVSDNPDFLSAVAQAGALPFLAMGNMPGPIAREGMELAAAKNRGRFGVGLIGLEVNRKCYESHLEIMSENPPPFAILAAGGVELAKRIEAIGTACYLHCPSPAILAEGLKSGLRRFVFEGSESGGHIGSLGSLILWNANLTELDAASRNGLDLHEVTVLFAGGIATGRAAAFLAGMVSDFVTRGLNVGLQMGTAYLATKEAVFTCAITPTYQALTLDSRKTVVIGRTVNTKARAAGSPMASELIEREHERLRNGMPLRERKELYEKDNLGALRLAAKGCAIDPNTATWDCPVFCDLPAEEQVNRGLYLMGQVVSLLREPCTIEALHSEIIHEGRQIFEMRLPQPEDEQVQAQDLALPEEVPVVEHVKEPIAVVGIGLRFPGSDSPDSFWEQIMSGRSGIVEVPPDRWGDSAFYYHPDPKAPDKTYTKIGGFITEFKFDPLKYRIPPAVAQKMDRTQQLAVTCVADALADAGLNPADLKGKRVGVIIGNSMGGETTDRYAERMTVPRTIACLEEAFSSLNLDDSTKTKLIEEFRSRYLEDLPDITEDSLPGELANVISGRVANVFNLEGPNFTVDAACASSMAAVMNAVAALRGGSIDYAVTGGVDSMMNPASFVKFCKIGALSPDGSRPFDEGANGFVMGEGAGMMLLKRLSDAVRAGDRIYGTVVEIGSSSDGRGKGITAPNAAGQERAVRACFDAAGIDPASVGLVEAHGTSTPVGDSTELSVLDKFFQGAGCAKASIGLGSVKSQIGHLKAAAGAAGIIKAVLGLHKRTLPPTVNVQRPNPCIDWESSPLSLVTEARPWEVAGGHIRRAGVSAFGFGGTNFHVLVQEHVPGLRVISGEKKAVQPVEFRPPDWPKPPEMTIEGDAWVIGGSGPGDLTKRIEKLLEQITSANASSLAAAQREESAGCEFRCGFAAQDAQAATEKLSLVLEGLKDPAKRAFFPARGIHVAQASTNRAASGVAFLFPGQGSQYPFMLRDLAERFPVVAETFEEADDILASLGLPTVSSCVFLNGAAKASAKDQADAMKDTQLLQPMILTANTAIFRLLAKMGIHPAAVAGHSLGEYAACVAASVFSFGDALRAVAVRGREMARVSIADPGLMMGIPADARVVEEVLAEVDGYVVAANKNSPKQTVISGETAAVKQAGELFRARGLEGVLLPVSAAFHSGVVAPAREPFMKTLEKLTVNPPLVPVLSNVTGDFYPVGPAAPGRIRDLLGKQFAAPVEWVKTLRRLYSEGIRIFLECGPKRVMTNLTSDTLSNDALALPTNHPKKGGIIQLMEALAALVAEGVLVDIGAAETLEEIARPETYRKRPELKIAPEPTTVRQTTETAPPLLRGLLDSEIEQMAGQPEFSRFLDIQGEPIRALIKAGFQSFVTNILPMEEKVRQVESEGMDMSPVVISGTAAGLPSDVRFPFDRATLDDLLLGGNFIKRIPEDSRRSMVEKNIERLLKGADGEVDLQKVEDVSGVIKLAGFFNDEDIIEEYGLDERLARSMDVTTRLAVAAGIEALRDAGIPLVQETRTTSIGQELPGSWTLPPALRAETGIIFASAFPGMASLVDEVTRETAARYGAGAKKRLIDFYTGLLGRIGDDAERARITGWFTEEFSHLNPAGSEELYTFNRDFLLKVISMAHAQLAQFIKAQGPNTHVDAACAGTTQAVLLARDWIRTGQAKRVILVAADDVAGKTLLPWVGSGFLAMGAATTNGNLSEAALPFDDRRHGLILGSAAVGIVLENHLLVKERGMEPIASIETGVVANSGFHGTRLDVEHISSVMEKMISKWEKQSGRSRDDLAREVFFMSHETYSPKRGGSSSAEVKALRSTFGDKARDIPIANTKGFTGHTMGVGVEDVVALRCLQKKLLPPIPNLKQPDPEFADLKLSRGGACHANYALRLAAGFGSQIVMALYKVVSREENRITDLATHRNWLRQVTGYTDPIVAVEQRTLRVVQRAAAQVTALVEAAPQKVPSPEAEMDAGQAKSATGADEVRTKILALLSDKTGYPADMLDTALDLEADLGIDTVKQAEFISEVRETFGIPRIEGLKIADFPTIEHIIEFVLAHTERSGSGSEGEETQSSGSAEGETEVREKILALLSQKTGYPADMLDTGLDLEADLGIDTVKQAEFISEVREIFSIPRIEGLKIADFPTINHIIAFVLERSRKAADTKATIETAGKQAETGTTREQEIGLFETRLVSLPPLEKIAAPEVDTLIIAGGPVNLADTIDEEAQRSGLGHVVRITEPVLPDGHADKRLGIINLFPLENDPDAVRKTFELYLAAAQAFDQGPAFLVTMASEDGAYGFENPSAVGYKAGAVAGATKSFAREYPDTLVRMLDVHPDLSPEKSAALVFRSLSESFPMETAVGPKEDLRTIRLVPVMEQSEEPGFRSGEVVLATGGARGITAACLKHLAEQHQISLVILGRTVLSSRAERLAEFGPEEWEQEKRKIVDRMKRDGKPPTPVTVEKELSKLRGEAEVYKNLHDLRATGSEVIYRPLDIRDGAAVDKAIQEVAELCGRVDLVIHAAGVDVSRALRNKTIEQIETVFSVKVEGMRNLLDSLDRHGMPPRRIVGFGSVAGRFGNMAQVDYSAANDALAHLLRRADREMDAKVSIIDWAPWSEIGMATRGSVQQTLEAAGIDFIPPDRGAEILARELARSSDAVEVLAGGRLGPFEADAFHQAGTEATRKVSLAGQTGEVVSILPGEYVKVRLFLNPSHPLLDHHRIDRAAVLPGVGGMEIMRAAAEMIDPAASRSGFGEVRFRSPLKVFKDEPFEAEVEVVRSERTADSALCYRARISSWFVNKEGRKMGSPRLHHECTLTISEETETTDLNGNKPQEFGRWNEAVWVTARDIYSVFFHGPGFRFLDHILLEGSAKGVRFRYADTKERPAMFADTLPGCVEACFQAAAGFAVESRGIMALPTGIDRVTVHSTGSMPCEGELIPVREASHAEFEGRKVFHFDAVVKDGKGNSLMTLEGVEMVELESSSGFPGKVFEQIVPVKSLSTEIKAGSKGFLKEMLDEDEVRQHAAKATPKRAKEWLAGRLALKKSVQRLLAASSGEMHAGKTILILQDDLGQPRAELSTKPGARVGEVSLSHSNGLAIAAASVPGTFRGLGVDMEKVEARSESWVADYFTEEEILAAGENDRRWGRLTEMWCLKEAALKALGTGLRFDLRDINVADLDEAGQARLEFRNEAARYVDESIDGSFEARVEEKEGIAVARVLIRKT